MIPAGIVDPTKVNRSALENAASIASTLLTTEPWSPTSPSPPAPAAPAAPRYGRHVLSQREKKARNRFGSRAFFCRAVPVDGAKKSCCFRHTEKQEIRRHPPEPLDSGGAWCVGGDQSGRGLGGSGDQLRLEESGGGVHRLIEAVKSPENTL